MPRKGEVNAWDNEDFVKAVKATGRKTLIMAGVWTSVCVMFPALDAKAAGYKVYAVMDASGDPSEMASRTTLARFAQAGVIPTSTNAVLCEIHRTWNRPEAAELAKLYAHGVPELPGGDRELPEGAGRRPSRRSNVETGAGVAMAPNRREFLATGAAASLALGARREGRPLRRRAPPT